MTINTIESLREHLQWAIELEHGTLPPYLCALYSIKPGHNEEAEEVIESVFVEEMLHMTLAANVLNAVGGTPAIDKPDFIPRYPIYLPHSADAFLVPLSRFSRETIETFMKIEKPEEAADPAEEDHFHTIGQFYQAIEVGLRSLCEQLGERNVFTGDPARQITAETLAYGGSGRVVAVYDLASALRAIDEIEEQGEGLKHAEVWDGDRNMFHHEREEVAHYFRYNEILQGRSYCRGDSPQSGPTGDRFEVNWDAVYPMRDNPRSDDYPDDSPVRAKMHEFDVTYSNLLRTLQAAFDGEPAQLGAAVGAMYDVKRLAQELMQMPSGDGVTTAGPAFEYVPLETAQAATPVKRIVIRANGPYVVQGGIKLVRKSIVYSEHGEPLTWKREEVLREEGEEMEYRLCRCGKSGHKPFCDGSHARLGFDGTETASPSTRESRCNVFEGERIVMKDDPSLCADAGFCGNRIEKVWNMIERTSDSMVRFRLMQMVERCPSGRLTYEINGEAIEPDLPREIAVITDGPLWVTGRIQIERSDGVPIEVRNRMTLCRCGQSSNKPLCDSTHAAVDWKEPADRERIFTGPVAEGGGG